MNTKILEKEQLAAIAELERLCFHKPWSEDALTLLTREGNFGVVSLDHGEVCAYVGLVTALDEGEITNVATHPNHRRQGHAKAVLLRLFDEAEKCGIRRITLEVRESNAAARALYALLGFTPCGTRKGFYTSPREDALILEKMIDSRERKGAF